VNDVPEAVEIALLVEQRIEGRAAAALDFAGQRDHLVDGLHAVRRQTAVSITWRGWSSKRYGLVQHLVVPDIQLQFRSRQIGFRQMVQAHVVEVVVCVPPAQHGEILDRLERSQTRICLFRRHRASWLSRRVRRAPPPEVAALVEDVEWFRRQRVAARLEGRQVESAVVRNRFHPNNCLARPGLDQFVTINWDSHSEPPL